jgi:hypothetical protein
MFVIAEAELESRIPDFSAAAAPIAAEVRLVVEVEVALVVQTTMTDLEVEAEEMNSRKILPVCLRILSGTPEANWIFLVVRRA